MAKEPKEHQSKIYMQGTYAVIEKPEIYFQFVTFLLKEHPAIVGIMNTLPLDHEDGSLLAFFNFVLKVKVTPTMTMGAGYQIFYNKLKNIPRDLLLKNAIAYVKAEQEIRELFTGNNVTQVSLPLPKIH